MYDWVELFRIDELIDLETACVTGEHSHLHAWLNVTGARHDSTNCDQLTDVLGPYVSHLYDLLLAEFAWHKDGLIVAFKLGWDSCLWVCVCALILTRNHTRLQLDVARHLHVKSSLLHNHIKAGLVFFAEVQAGLGHVCIDYFMENLDVGCSVANDSLDKTMVAIGTKSINYQFN